jgi:signal peptide peptidase SppA
MPEQARQFARVRRYLTEQVWAMWPPALESMLAVVELRASGVRLADDEIEARIAAARHQAGQVVTSGAIAVLPLYGIISQRMNIFTEISGGTSTDAFSAAFRRAMNDPEIGATVIDADGPGGSVFGVQETAALIRSYRGAKPIIAVVNSTAASATAWIALQADEVVIAPSGEAGSIGVICLHENHSGEAEREGVQYTFITSSGAPYKSEGNPYEELGAEATAYYKARLDTYEGVFFKDLAKARGITTAKVRSDFGKGRMLLAGEAVSAGMADRVGTLQEVVEQLAAKLAKGRGRGGASAGTPPAPITAEQARFVESRDLPTEGELAGLVVTAEAPPAAEPCECTHARADHRDDGPCTVDECDCEGYVPADDEDEGAKAMADDTSRERVLATLRLAEVGG